MLLDNYLAFLHEGMGSLLLLLGALAALGLVRWAGQHHQRVHQAAGPSRSVYPCPLYVGRSAAAADHLAAGARRLSAGPAAGAGSQARRAGGATSLRGDAAIGLAYLRRSPGAGVRLPGHG